MSARLFHLKDTPPIATGHMRLVFRHPDDASLLIKVIRPDVIDARWGSGASWYKRRRRYGRYSSFIRELQEFVAAWSAHGESLHFVQRIVGFAETDLGLGLVLHAVRGRDGNYARPLVDMIVAGEYTPEVAAALEWAIQQLLDCEVVISDPHAGNFVYAFTPEHGDHFVLIDGLGNNNVLPFKFLSRWVNRRSKHGRFDRLRRYIAGLVEQREKGLIGQNSPRSSA